MNWQPIETAPKDGTSVLLADNDEIQICQWSERNVFGVREWCYGHCEGEYNSRYTFDCPTHWMPLPEPPK
jgi:hypothetical protein